MNAEPTTICARCGNRVRLSTKRAVRCGICNSPMHIAGDWCAPMVPPEPLADESKESA